MDSWEKMWWCTQLLAWRFQQDIYKSTMPKKTLYNKFINQHLGNTSNTEAIEEMISETIKERQEKY